MLGRMQNEEEKWLLDFLVILLREIVNLVFAKYTCLLGRKIKGFESLRVSETTLNAAKTYIFRGFPLKAQGLDLDFNIFFLNFDRNIPMKFKTF